MAHVVTVVLPDSNPKGLRHIEVANWSGKAYVVPRAELQTFKKLDEGKLPGVYFLFGDGEERKKVYIGQSETVASRLTNHDAKREEDEWNEAVVFVGELDSSLIKYIESYTVTSAKDAGRYDVSNSTAPKLNKLSAAQKITAEQFVDYMKIVVGLFGYHVFAAAVRKEDAVDVYHAEDKKDDSMSADGALLNTGEFIVYKGSKARIKIADSLPEHGPNVIRMREELLQKGILKEFNKKSYILTDDYIFSSPSFAATNMAGRSANGWTTWKDKNGKTLDEKIRK